MRIKNFIFYYLIVLLMLALLPVIETSYEVIEPRQKTETYWDIEPRLRTETYFDKEPYQITKTGSEAIIDDKDTVPAGKILYYKRYIDFSGKDKNIVSGKITETAGYDINFYVFDQENYNAWRNGMSFSSFVTAKSVRSHEYSFAPSRSDYYYFVLDNGYSMFTNKVPSTTATWDYQEKVTEYRNVAKTRTVTEYVNVQKTRTVTEYVSIQKTKRVSLFQLLTESK